MACWSNAVTNTMRHGRAVREQPPGHLEPGEPRHLHVEKDQVGLVICHRFQCVRTALRLSDDLDNVAHLVKQVAQFFPRERLVVHYECTKRLRHWPAPPPPWCRESRG